MLFAHQSKRQAREVRVIVSEFNRDYQDQKKNTAGMADLADFCDAIFIWHTI